MKFELYEMGLSGEKTKIYSPMMDGASSTLFEIFLEENDKEFKAEIEDIVTRLDIAGFETGILEESFDTRSSKKRGDICTFKDLPGRYLRLFFICYGKSCIILGGGGVKEKHFIKRQEVAKLNDEMEILEEISTILEKAIKSGKLNFDEEGNLLGTNGLTFKSDNL